VSKLVIWLICLNLCLGLAACKREQRQFTAPPSTFKSYDVTMSDIHPGSAGLPLPVRNHSDERAYDANAGKQLFMQYN
jgi:hypothetical protein